ncbi:MAG TPA: rod shape-determining protein MreD [Streptosporangiaceae bacterium]|jgi:rod shape-determining protein MreD
MRRLLISVVLCAVALAAQLTVVNRLALPGGAGPDLVLLVVVALALTGGPVPGMLTGFLAGLALDVAPPAGHTIGQYALVFTLVGYLCGRLAALGEESPALYVAISAGAAAVGAVLYAVLGVMLSDPQVTWAAVQHVLPPLVVYNVLLSPFVLFGVVKLNGWAGHRETVGGASAALSSAAASAIGAAGLPTGAVRQASASGSPRLHLGERRGGDAWIAAARTSGPARPSALGGTPQREPRLRASGLRGPGGSASGLGGASRGYTGPKAAPRVNFRGRRSPFAGRKATALSHSSAAPKFRKRSMSASIGSGSSLGRATPRRGTFGRGRSFRQRSALGGTMGGRRAFGRSAGPRLTMRRGSWFSRLFHRNPGGFR